jgi:cytochrome c biogenesis protein CcmG, thiol:disulfide interchange protein DsbE
MMFVSLGIGTLVAILLIGLVTYFTGGHVSQKTGLPTTALVGKRVASFTLPQVNGSTVSAPYASGHPTVLIFFASYCTPCQHEMPEVASYLRTHSTGRVHVLGIDASDVMGSVQNFLKQDKVPFPVAFDASDKVTTGIFQFGQIPETVFLNGKGVVQSVYFGAVPKSTLIAGIAKLNQA